MDDGRNSSFKASSQQVEKKMSWSQTEDVGKKKSAELSIKAATVSCERMQLYSILTKVTIPTLVAKASTPHSLK